LYTAPVLAPCSASAQDVAEAARQERAQNESKQKKSKHVYTEQELKRAQILTPEIARSGGEEKSAGSPSAKNRREAVGRAIASCDALRRRPLAVSETEAAAETFSVRGVFSIHLPMPRRSASRSLRDADAPAGSETCSARAFAPSQPSGEASPFERPRFSSRLLVLRRDASRSAGPATLFG